METHSGTPGQNKKKKELKGPKWRPTVVPQAKTKKGVERAKVETHSGTPGQKQKEEKSEPRVIWAPNTAPYVSLAAQKKKFKLN